MNIYEVLERALSEVDEAQEYLTILALLLEKDKTTLSILHPELIYVEADADLEESVIHKLYEYISENPLHRFSSEIFWVMGKANPKISLPFLTKILKSYAGIMKDEEIYQMLIALDNCLLYIKHDKSGKIEINSIKNILVNFKISNNSKIIRQIDHMLTVL